MKKAYRALNRILKQFRMPFDCFFNLLRLNLNVALCNGRAAVKQEPLDKLNIMPVVHIDFGRISLSEAVSAYAGIAKIITYLLKSS